MEKKFNIQESFIVKLQKVLDEENENINEKDKKFFNLGIIMELGRLSQKFSYNCDECKANKDVLMNTATGMATKINTLEGRRKITKDLDIVSTHLRKAHKRYIRRYLSSLWTIIFLAIGLAVGAITGYFLSTYKVPIVIGGGVGLLIGVFVGGIVEAMKKKNGQVYGKF